MWIASHHNLFWSGARICFSQRQSNDNSRGSKCLYIACWSWLQRRLRRVQPQRLATWHCDYLVKSRQPSSINPKRGSKVWHFWSILTHVSAWPRRTLPKTFWWHRSNLPLRRWAHSWRNWLIWDKDSNRSNWLCWWPESAIIIQWKTRSFWVDQTKSSLS